jgi:hypothetical protein
MNIQEILWGPAGQRLAWTLLHFVWQGFLAGAGVAMTGRLFPAARASGRYAVALAGLVLMACCPFVTFAMLSASLPRPVVVASKPEMPGPDPPTYAPPHAAAVESAEPSTPPSDTVTARPSIAVVAGPPEAAEPAEELAEAPDWAAVFRERATAIQPYAVMGWLAGVVLLSGRLLASLLGVRRLARRRLPVSEELAACAVRLARRLGLAELPRIFFSKPVREAVLVGLWRPMVLLPAAWMTEMPPDVLEAVIAHELAHVRRLDLWANLLQRLVETLLFYHPAVWWLSRRVSVQREMCADDLKDCDGANRPAGGGRRLPSVSLPPSRSGATSPTSSIWRSKMCRVLPFG